MQHMYANIPFLFDYWANPFVFLLLLQSSMLSTFEQRDKQNEDKLKLTSGSQVLKALPTQGQQNSLLKTFLFDYWANPFVFLLLLQSSMLSTFEQRDKQNEDKLKLTSGSQVLKALLTQGQQNSLLKVKLEGRRDGLVVNECLSYRVLIPGYLFLQMMGRSFVPPVANLINILRS